MLDGIVRYADDAAGLEKALRLAQGFCTIAVGLADAAEEAVFWAKMRSQFALGRRYFRLLKWQPCWKKGLEAFHEGNDWPTRRALNVAKWSFLGMYFFLEMFTFTNALGATDYQLGPTIQQEANKCWFYALVSSLMLASFDLSLTRGAPTITRRNKPSSTATDGKTNGAYKSGHNDATLAADGGKEAQSHLYQQMVVDFCDLFIPGAAVGWISVGPILVGTMSTISTLVAARQIWNRVQAKSQTA